MGQDSQDVSRRDFLRTGTALAAAPLSLTQVIKPNRFRADHTADIVIAGGGASGLAAAVSARDSGASVIVIDENHDFGGHAMLSGGRISLGGGNSWQKKWGIQDSIEQVFLDHTDHRNPLFKYSDRALVRMWSDENLPTLDFLLENGIRFNDVAPQKVWNESVPRNFVAIRYSDNLAETIQGRGGSGVVRPLEASARKKGATFLASHKLVRLLSATPSAGPVYGVVAQHNGKDVTIRARKGVILCTGGHTSDVDFRRMFDPRLTEEYQVTGEPWSKQTAAGERLAMAVGAVLWGTANQQNGLAITKTKHIGCRYGYVNLKWDPKSPMFPLAKATGLTVEDYQNLILVNQMGARVWNEVDSSEAFFDACMGTNGATGGTGGGGPIWAIFDADAAAREKWNTQPPNVDPDGYFFSANTLAELAAKIANPYQRASMPAATLEAAVARYNKFVDAGKDDDFAKPTPKYKIAKAPFYAAWSTPILHDTLTGLRINPKCQVIDLGGQTIQGLYAAGECAGGFGLHGLTRVLVFGRVAGREAARSA